MNQAHHHRLHSRYWTEDVLVGAWIYDRNDESVGTISRLYGAGLSMAVVAHVGMAVGVSGKIVMIPSSVMGFLRDADGTLHATTLWTKDQITALPAHAHPRRYH